MIGLLAVVLGVCLAPGYGAPYPCPEGITIPEGASANGKWYLQFATPVFTPTYCSIFNTGPQCRCISVNASYWIEDGKVNYESIHFGYNANTRNWAYLPVTGIQKLANKKMVYELNTAGRKSPSNAVVLATDNFETWGTATACNPLKDIDGVKRVMPYWVLTRAVQPTDDVLQAALSSLPPEVVPTLARIPHDECPM